MATNQDDEGQIPIPEKQREARRRNSTQEQSHEVHNAIKVDELHREVPVEDSEDSKQVATQSTSSETEDPPAESEEVTDAPKFQQLAPEQRREKSKSGAPAVKVTMDLDVEVELKAKIKGDLELSILNGNRK